MVGVDRGMARQGREREALPRFPIEQGPDDLALRVAVRRPETGGCRPVTPGPRTVRSTGFVRSKR
jgi:hypothetical protein